MGYHRYFRLDQVFHIQGVDVYHRKIQKLPLNLSILILIDLKVHSLILNQGRNLFHFKDSQFSKIIKKKNILAKEN